MICSWKIFWIVPTFLIHMRLLVSASLKVQRKMIRIRGTDYPSETDRITDEMANLFYARFWGRQDVYAKRSEKKSTGEAGYYTQCHNRWENICPKMRHEKMNCKDCPYQVYKQLTIKDIRAHLQGRSYSEKNLLLLGTFVLGSFFNKRNVVKLGCSHKVV